MKYRTWSLMLLAGMAAPALGQSSPDGDKVGETVVVTGQRTADRNTIKTKRETIQVVDAISADNIGQMADFSVGDALKRIAGVNVYTYQGEPRFAVIRGFNSNYITTTLDGLQIASPDNQNQGNGGGRQFYLETLPSNIASRIEVYKTNTADMNGHSIGGSINFAIPSAFDFATDQFNLLARGGMELMDSKYGGSRPTGEAEALITHRFGPAGTVGVTLSASYWRRDQWIPQTEQGSSDRWYSSAGSDSGTAYVGTGPVGVERRWYDYDDSRERYSFLGKLDWRPDERLETSLTGFYFGQHETALRHTVLASFGAGAVVTNQTASTGTISPRATSPSDISQSVQYFKLYFNKPSYGTQATTKYSVSEKLQLNAAVGYSHASYNNPQISNYFSQSGLAFNYAEGSDGIAISPVNPVQYGNLAAYKGGTASSNPQYYLERYTTSADHYEAKLDLAYNMDRGDRGFGIQAGATSARNDHVEKYTKTYDTGMPYTLADVISDDTHICGLNCNGSAFFAVDNSKLQALLDKYLPFAISGTDTANQFGKTFSVREIVSAAYGMARWRAENWSLIGGLRYEWTDFNTSGFTAVTAKVGGASVTNYVPATSDAQYGHLLPSAMALYDINDTMRVRAAYSRTLGRPKFTDMGMLGGALNTSDASNPTLKIGNPDLKPRISDNLDLIYEWYFDQSQGLFTLGLFHKSVAHEIYLLGQNAPIDEGNGVMVNGVVTSPVNSRKMTTVDGIEFNLVKYFDFLPGPLSHLGVSANGILSHANFPILLVDGTAKTFNALPNQAKLVTNLALFYEGDDVHVRVAWNHTGSFVEDRYFGTGTAGASSFYRIRWTQPTENVDVSASYDIDDVYTVRFDASNLLGVGVDTNIGLDREIPLARMTIPTAVLFGVSARF
jgi:TonB-dependent receptor